MAPSPVYPWLHVQVKLPGVLVHIALESQLLVVASAHSSTSDKMTLNKYILFKLYHCIIPSQVVPFPVYPWLHVQVKLPGVLVHVALESQLLVVELAHSMALMDLAKTRMEKLNFNCDQNKS